EPRRCKPRGDPTVAGEVLIDGSSRKAGIGHVLRPIPARRHGAPVRPAEKPAPCVVLLDCEAALVHSGVVRRAKKKQIVEAVLPAVRPVLDVMRLDETLAAAARKPAAAITRP